MIPQFYERMKKLLPYAVKNTTNPQIIERLLSITLDGQRLSFSNTNLIRTIVHANERDNNDVLIIILPYLLKLFDIENDPDPAQVKLAVDNYNSSLINYYINNRKLLNR